VSDDLGVHRDPGDPRSPEPTWVPTEVILAAHDLLLRQHGGRHGFGEFDVFEHRPWRREYWRRYREVRSPDPEGDLAWYAALYVSEICRCRPFVDGNRRTALMTALIFLRLNGYALDAETVDVVVHVRALAKNVIDEKAFARAIELGMRAGPPGVSHEVR